jgi:hypothetical protein
MSSKPFDDVIRKAIDLNVRYYSSMGRLALDYWRDLFATVAEPVKAAVSPAPSSSANAPAGSASATAAKPAVMVMEAEAGSVAQGVFMVENHLNHDVDSTVVASFFKDPANVAVQPLFTFDPPRVALKPHEQILVCVSTTIGSDLQPETRYTGEFAVPGLKGTSIPVVLRSRRKQ